VTSPHEIVNPAGLARPSGFSHTIAARPGRTIYVGGQTAHDAEGNLTGASMVEQFERAAGNLLTALTAAGAGPEHLVQLHIFVTDAAGYRAALGELGEAYRRHLGRHYPAVALFEVAGLYDPEARIELTAIAVVPE
jgi:enamine deaminase RidA (YjgF/YER057c/UK114 family)